MKGISQATRTPTYSMLFPKYIRGDGCYCQAPSFRTISKSANAFEKIKMAENIDIPFEHACRGTAKSCAFCSWWKRMRRWCTVFTKFTASSRLWQDKAGRAVGEAYISIFLWQTRAYISILSYIEPHPSTGKTYAYQHIKAHNRKMQIDATSHCNQPEQNMAISSIGMQYEHKR